MASEPGAIQQLRERRRVERVTESTKLDTRSAILAATERLLGEVALYDVSVAMIMERSGVSRKTFYSYFESKFEVVATLLQVVMDGMFAILETVVEPSADQSREQKWRSLISDSVRLRVQHRGIFNAAHENWHAVTEIRVQWLSAVERFTDAIAAELDDDREAGSPTAEGNRQRAAAALWAMDHVLYLAGADAVADLPDEDAVVETLVAMWMGTLYGVTAPASAAARSSRSRSRRPR